MSNSILGSNPLGFITNNESVFTSIDSSLTSFRESYFNDTLIFVSECNKEFDAANRSWYKAITESNNDQEVITESFHDFFVKVKEIIDKFIAYIKSLFERFWTNVEGVVKSDKYLKKHKDDFKKFSSEDEFDFTGYEFTINAGIPVAEVVQAKFTETFIGFELANDEKTDAAKLANKAKTVYDALIKELEYDFYDKFRQEIINAKYPITQSDFSGELFSTFRGDTSDKTTLTIDQIYVMQAYNRFNDYSSAKKDAENIRKRLEKEYEEVKKQILNMAKTSYTGNNGTMSIDLYGTSIDNIPTSSESIKYVDLFMKAKAGQVQEMSNIHALAFAAKLDALKDQFMQDKTILYKALSKIQKVHKETVLDLGNDYTDYTKELAYGKYLAECVENQQRMERFVNECCIVAEGTEVYAKIQALNENKLTEFFKKIIDWIKKIFAKFTEKMGEFFKSDKKYLEKYKDIILGKKFPDGYKVEMQNYPEGLKRIAAKAVPEFNYQMLSPKLAEGATAFAKGTLGFSEYDDSKYDTFAEYCKDYFCGGPDVKEFNNAQMNTMIKDMYDFCYDFKTIESKITKDKNTIENAAKKAENILVQASADNKDARDAAAKPDSDEGGSEQKPNEEGYIYSEYFGGYVNEDGAKISTDNNNNSSTSNTNNSDNEKKLANAINNIHPSDMNDEEKKAAGDAAVKIAGGKEEEQVRKECQVYTDTCVAMLGAKLTDVQKIYKDYMKIIRDHVSRYVGTNDNKDNRSGKASGTNYADLSEKEKKEMEQMFEDAKNISQEEFINKYKSNATATKVSVSKGFKKVVEYLVMFFKNANKDKEKNK